MGDNSWHKLKTLWRSLRRSSPTPAPPARKRRARSAVHEPRPALTRGVDILEPQRHKRETRWELVSDYHERWGDLSAEQERHLKGFIKGS